MTFLIIAALLVGAFIAFRVARNNARRNDYEQRSARQPLDPALAEVFHRTAGESDWKTRSAADQALRDATPHIHRMVTERRQAPVLILHQTTSNSYVAKGGLLVVATDMTLLFTGGKVSTVSHRSGTSTAIQGTANTIWVDVQGGDGSFSYSCDTLEIARLVCEAIDTWAENPEVRHVPGAHITPQRVELPVDFYAGVLRASGHQITEYNLRALQERFGMLFVHYARGIIDTALGLEAGERFTREQGRPSDDRELAHWPESVLRAFIALRPKLGHSTAPYLPGKVHSILLENYLASPGRPLSMWMSEEYENDGTGPRRYGARGNRPPMPA